MRKLYILIGRVSFVLLLPLLRIYLKDSQRVYLSIVYQGKIILVKNWLARDTWRLPGGGIGKNETPKQAVLREAKEELRLVLQEVKLATLNSGTMQVDGLGFHYTNYVYVMDTFPRRLENQYEIVEYGLFDEAPHGSQPVVHEVIDLLRQQKLLY